MVASSSIPVIAGLTVGIAFLVTMILVAGGLEGQGRSFDPTSGNSVGEDFVDADGCCGEVASLTFDHELKLTIEQNDR